jgi:hypothetical protein
MADGIRDKVAILGMGCSKFGERWESGAEDLAAENFRQPISALTSMKSTWAKQPCRWQSN